MTSLAVVRHTETEIIEAEVFYSETDLDKEVLITLGLKRDLVAGHWRLGRQLNHIHSNKIWRARLDADGNPLYENFDKFCRSELNMSDTNAFNLMDVAKNFPEEMVAQIGTWKLGFILKAPPEIQAKLLEKAKDGASLRNIRDEVQAARDEAGMTRIRRQKKEEREIVTMVELEGEKVIPFYTEESVRNRNFKATKSVDDAVGFHYLVNDVVLTVKLVKNADGELIGKLNISRV